MYIQTHIIMIILHISKEGFPTDKNYFISVDYMHVFSTFWLVNLNRKAQPTMVCAFTGNIVLDYIRKSSE